MFGKNKIQLGSLLKGCRMGSLQSVGLMQIIPLIDHGADGDRFADPREAIVSTSTYGTVVVRNPSARVLIVPLNAAYMSKRNTQDHAVTTAGVLGSSGSCNFTNSLCIEAGQSGTMEPDQYRLSILPASLRADSAPMSLGGADYGDLWLSVGRFNAELGSGPRDHLRDFFERFAQELDEFIAQFEPVPGQVGAIVLIGGEIVGLERAPSHVYWLGVWQALIRDCYGSRAMQAARRLVRVPATRAKLAPVGALVDLPRAVDDAEHRERIAAEELVSRISAEKLSVGRPHTDHRIDDLKVKVVKNDRMVGQAIYESREVIYASMVAAGV